VPSALTIGSGVNATVTVGAGGALGSTGSSSVFSNISTSGGGILRLVLLVVLAEAVVVVRLQPTLEIIVLAMEQQTKVLLEVTLQRMLGVALVVAEAAQVKLVKHQILIILYLLVVTESVLILMEMPNIMLVVAEVVYQATMLMALLAAVKVVVVEVLIMALRLLLDC
jgi:hypothetical protein